jgi:hypothetical protein
VLKGILCLLNYFQTYLDIRLIYKKCLHINTTYIFNINLVYQTYEHYKKRLVMKKLAPICLVYLNKFVSNVKYLIIIISQMNVFQGDDHKYVVN